MGSYIEQERNQASGEEESECTERGSKEGSWIVGGATRGIGTTEVWARVYMGGRGSGYPEWYWGLSMIQVWYNVWINRGKLDGGSPEILFRSELEKVIKCASLAESFLVEWESMEGSIGADCNDRLKRVRGWWPLILSIRLRHPRTIATFPSKKTILEIILEFRCTFFLSIEKEELTTKCFSESGLEIATRIKGSASGMILLKK